MFPTLKVDRLITRRIPPSFEGGSYRLYFTFNKIIVAVEMAITNIAIKISLNCVGCFFGIFPPLNFFIFLTIFYVGQMETMDLLMVENDNY